MGRSSRPVEEGWSAAAALPLAAARQLPAAQAALALGLAGASEAGWPAAAAHPLAAAWQPAAAQAAFALALPLALAPHHVGAKSLRQPSVAQFLRARGGERVSGPACAPATVG
jgi:hypothetical protein